MTRYQQSVAESAEYLRLAIPLMSRQSAGFHPISYAIWYEYAAGINRPLREAIDALTADGRKLDEVLTAELFHRHVAEVDEKTAHEVSTGFQRVLTDISGSAATAGNQAARFGSALEQWRVDLISGAEDNHRTAVSRLLGDTRVMQGAVVSLTERLESSRQEIAVLRQQVARAREDALADGLTGLVNRKGFDRAIAACLAEAEQGSCGPSLLITDIDHFKRVNDDFGHLFGDKVLRKVAQILKQNVKGRDTAARYGGEEFVILLPETPLSGAGALAERIRTNIEGSRVRRSDTHEALARVTVSVGVASYRRGESANDFIDRADRALYAAKETGRNRVTLEAA